MYGNESLCHAQHGVRCQLGWNPPLLGFGAAQQAIQVDALDVLHGKVGLALDLPCAENRHDIRVMHGLMQFRLAFERFVGTFASVLRQKAFDDETGSWEFANLRSSDINLGTATDCKTAIEQERTKRDGLRPRSVRTLT